MSPDKIQANVAADRLASFLSGFDPDNKDIIARACSELCSSLEESHICVRAPEPEKLLASRVCGRPGDHRPFVIDAQGLLYLNRHWVMQKGVADAVRSRLVNVNPDRKKLDEYLDILFSRENQGNDGQRRAAELCCGTNFAVVTGGPGTGKTTTVFKVLVLLQLLAENPLKIKMAAPTGKAAARLGISLLKASQSLKIPEIYKKVFEFIPDTVETVHRLLKWRPGPVMFRYGPEEPLDCDVLVLDEASMCSLPLMYRLLAALPERCRIILIGDKDQLASVEEGKAFADICDSEALKRSNIAVLTENFRVKENPGLADLARAVNNGSGQEALDILKSGNYGLSFSRLADRKDLAEGIQKRCAGFYPLCASGDEISALEALEKFIILTPYRRTPFGTEGLNSLVRDALKGLGKIGEIEQGQYENRPLLVTENSRELGLFNGDLGVVRKLGGSFGVFFPPDSGGEAVPRSFTPQVLPDSESAYALTIHKSQGAEFDRVVLILPPLPEDHEDRERILTRELVYTALTRAKQEAEVWGDETAFFKALCNRTVRLSGLKDMLI